MHTKLIEILKPTDLQADMKFVAEVCGFDIAKILVEKLGGTTISIPMIKNNQKVLLRYIKENRNKSPLQLAIELDRNKRHIMKLIKLLDNSQLN